MADLLIKDMVMPDRCGVCALCNPFFDKPYCHRYLRNVPPMGRPDWCPLVEVLEHGRLIDADKLSASLSDEILRRGGDERSLGIAWAQIAVEVAPTVIDASEVDNES